MNLNEYKKCLAKFATGITIITGKYKDEIFGLTVNSFASVSLDPKIILFCIDNKYSHLTAMINSNHFVVNILSKKQQKISKLFASDPDRFNKTGYHFTKNGVPIINDNSAYLECIKIDAKEVGDHHIFFCMVEKMSISEDKEPLLYYSSGYYCLGEKI